jgi:hypothetical protein
MTTTIIIVFVITIILENLFLIRYVINLSKNFNEIKFKLDKIIFESEDIAEQLYEVTKEDGLLYNISRRIK